MHLALYTFIVQSVSPLATKNNNYQNTIQLVDSHRAHWTMAKIEQLLNMIFKGAALCAHTHTHTHTRTHTC